MTQLSINTFTASALSAISFYQRWLSPLKGFRCAHAALYGGESCSAAVARVISEQGLTGSASAISARFQACRSAFDQLSLGQHVTGGARVRGVCCCGPLPIPFRCG
ncbi:membrane protein insertion efficiency factor YidD [Deinococcus sp. QL22]|uniref:membrane protein insertion efficiency factor YidD n=1 Tax=Deinococcus sp. QL22 TaxID=2939437 RepID=UPI002016B971|nr:membrane protein insertion efficiency factor YidD [Deinococcus sp. QL22]UQN09617.1 membrane protein insertion efficiency factor YidD [Deinococcus sp. QL22]